MSTSYSGADAAVNGKVKTLGILTMVAGGILMIAGLVTWIAITNQLEAEKITVSDDAPCMAGKPVNGPIDAFCQAEIINTHALKSTGGKTYAELSSDDPTRDTAMKASFLRASLFTSVVAYGVAAMAFGLGIIFQIVGSALTTLSKR